MSEQAIEAVAAPLLADAEKALAPEAARVLGSLRERLTAEADHLRTQLPALVQDASERIHAISAAVLDRYQSVIDDIDAHLHGAPAPVVAPPPATTETPAGATTGPGVKPTQTPS